MKYEEKKKGREESEKIKNKFQLRKSESTESSSKTEE